MDKIGFAFPAFGFYFEFRTLLPSWCRRNGRSDPKPDMRLFSYFTTIDAFAPR
jgi:hypothetical protein